MCARAARVSRGRRRTYGARAAGIVRRKTAIAFGKIQSACCKLRDVVSEPGVHGSLDFPSGFEGLAVLKDVAPLFRKGPPL
jgi:hypothetical protein